VAKPKTVLIDELHLAVRVPADLPEAEADAVRRALAEAEFLGRLRWAIRAVLRGFPELTTARVSLTR
jgi:hypothetical protein